MRRTLLWQKRRQFDSRSCSRQVWHDATVQIVQVIASNVDCTFEESIEERLAIILPLAAETNVWSLLNIPESNTANNISHAGPRAWDEDDSDSSDSVASVEMSSGLQPRECIPSRLVTGTNKTFSVLKRMIATQVLATPAANPTKPLLVHLYGRGSHQGMESKWNASRGSFVMTSVSQAAPLVSAIACALAELNQTAPVFIFLDWSSSLCHDVARPWWAAEESWAESFRQPTFVVGWLGNRGIAEGRALLLWIQQRHDDLLTSESWAELASNCTVPFRMVSIQDGGKEFDQKILNLKDKSTWR